MIDSLLVCLLVGCCLFLCLFVLGVFQLNRDPQQPGHGGQGAGGQGSGGQGAGSQATHNVSIFQTLNQRLIDLGIPHFDVGVYRLEPIVIVAFLLAMLLFGLPGLLFAGILFGVVMLSGGVGGGDGGDSGGSRRGSMGGGDRGQRRHRGGRTLRHR